MFKTASEWIPLPPGTSGDPNTIDVLWLAYGLEDSVKLPYPTAAITKGVGITVVEHVETFIGGRLLRSRSATDIADRAARLSTDLAPLLDHSSLMNLAISFYLWHGCILMAKSLRRETSAHERYTSDMRLSSYQDLNVLWEKEGQRGNPWIKNGVRLARALEHKRGNSPVDDWVPRSSPYWD